MLKKFSLEAKDLLTNSELYEIKAGSNPNDESENDCLACAVCISCESSCTACVSSMIDF